MIPLKKAYEIDLAKYLKAPIKEWRGCVNEVRRRKLGKLNQNRRNATSKTMNTRQEHSLEILQK